MNKAQLIDALAERLGDKRTAAAAVDGVVDVIVRTVNKGERVNITGFGVFEKRARAARMARNPRTGEAVRVKKTNVPAFRAGTTFRDIVSGSKKLPKAVIGTAGTAAVAAGSTAARTAKQTATVAARTAATVASKATDTALTAAAKAAPGTSTTKPTTAGPAKPASTRATGSKATTKSSTARTGAAKQAMPKGASARAAAMKPTKTTKK